MTTAIRCRAEGGALYCNDADCPEKRAGFIAFYGSASPARAAGRAIGEINRSSSTVIEGIGTDAEKIAGLRQRARTFRSSIDSDEEWALSRYGDMDSTEINTYLKKGSKGLAEEFSQPFADDVEKLEEINLKIELIDSAMAKQPKLDEPQTIYRSFAPKDIETNLEDYIAQHYPVGKGMKSKSYLSTSVDVDLMISRHEHKPVVVFEISTRTAGALIYGGGTVVSAEEREVLLPRDLKLHVVNVRDVLMRTPSSENGQPARERRCKIVRLEEVEN